MKAASRKAGRRRSDHRRKVLYAFAAAGLFVAIIASGILFVTLTPTTLRIAVTTTSDDARIVEAIPVF